MPAHTLNRMTHRETIKMLQIPKNFLSKRVLFLNVEWFHFIDTWFRTTMVPFKGKKGRTSNIWRNDVQAILQIFSMRKINSWSYYKLSDSLPPNIKCFSRKRRWIEIRESTYKNICQGTSTECMSFNDNQALWWTAYGFVHEYSTLVSFGWRGWGQLANFEVHHLHLDFFKHFCHEPIANTLFGWIFWSQLSHIICRTLRRNLTN